MMVQYTAIEMVARRSLVHRNSQQFEASGLNAPNFERNPQTTSEREEKKKETSNENQSN